MKNIPRLLERHCPKWYKLLKEISFDEIKENHYVESQRLNMGDSRFCLVGEKHNFTTLYFPFQKHTDTCEQCYLLSDQMYWAKKERGFIFLLKKFVKHCELKHPKQIY